MSLNPSNIDYLREARARIGRSGYTSNIITGCKHGCGYCYARRMVENGRLKGRPSYPYGFEPTFHPERIRAYGGKPKLIFLNDMGDVGGNWDWIDPRVSNAPHLPPSFMAREMVHFANINPNHIILLLTKNPSWYGLVDWPENVWCGYTATCNADLYKHLQELPDNLRFRFWISMEPWLDDDAPNLIQARTWLVIGGLSGPNARSVSDATLDWLQDPGIKAKRFTEENAIPNEYDASHPTGAWSFPREYPEEWRVEE